MTRHLLKLIWNRKRTNFLLMLELFFSFLVLFAVVTLGLFYLDNYRQPLGYDYADVWCVQVDTKTEGPMGWTPEAAEGFERVVTSVAELPPVVAAAPAFTAPYEEGSWSSDYMLNGRHYEYELDSVGESFKDVVGLEITRGRWFSREDDAATTFKPVVVNERMAREIFAGDDPIGKSVPQDKDSDGKPRTEMRIVGVIREYRQHGEFSTPANYVFHRHTNHGTDEQAAPLRIVLVKVRPGTPAAFEETLLARLQATARDWSFTVKPLVESREANHRARLAPVIAFGLVAGFLLLMVALGLTGVLWQNVTQRTREIGLRRAKGATIPRVQRQILGELTVMTSLALLVGVLVVVQFPLLDLLGYVRPAVFAASLAVSIAALYGVTLVCGWYPSRLATRVPPAEALRYE
jgi:putative ABC transport system permease protein